MSAKRKRLAWEISAGITLLFFLNLCHMLFQCGCRSLWNGADLFCNVHTAGVAHCPWCSYGWWGFIIIVATILLAQTGILYLPSKLSLRNRWLLSLAAFPVAGAMVGFLFAVFSGYPVFLWLRLS